MPLLILFPIQPEKYFTTLNSDVLKIARVTYGHKTRIMALAEVSSCLRK